MGSEPREDVTLNERMQRIEKQNRRLKLSMTFMALTLLALVAIGAAADEQDARFRNITAERVTIVGPGGRELIHVGYQQDKGAGIRIFNQAGTRVVGLGVPAEDDGCGILIADKNGTPRIGLGMDEGVPSLALTNEKGKKILAFGGDDRGYGFVVMDKDETERVGMGFKDGDVGVAIYDDEGGYVRGMIMQKDGVHYSSYVDEDGKEVYVR